jgi:hypothetical protein
MAMQPPPFDGDLIELLFDFVFKLLAEFGFMPETPKPNS